MKKLPAPDVILQFGFGFWASRTLLSAVEMGLFTLLAKGALDPVSIQRRLKLHPRATRDFLDALLAMGILRRAGGKYSNSPEADFYLDQNKPGYCGGILEMCGTRLYAFWGSLSEALRTGKPQNEASKGKDIFKKLYSDPKRLQSFLSAMTGISIGAARAIAAKFPWKNYQTFADVGCAQGGATVQIALANKHLRGTGFDLSPVRPIFQKYVKSFKLSNRVSFSPGDFFGGDMPEAEVLVMGHILHDWDEKQKVMLLKKAYAALPKGGALIVYDAVIDDDRSKNLFGLLMSLNMLIETPGGFDYTGADCRRWMKKAGFENTRVEHLVGPDSMIIGIK